LSKHSGTVDHGRFKGVIQQRKKRTRKFLPDRVAVIQNNHADTRRPLHTFYDPKKFIRPAAALPDYPRGSGKTLPFN
jgi:hypothetical protein